jgi:hypothetical protein
VANPPSFSRRTDVRRELNPLAQALADVRASGRPVLDLTESNPTHAGIPCDRDGILLALADPRALVYDPEPFGLESARAVVAEEWEQRGIAVDPEQIVLTASTSEAYSYVFKLLCNPGDKVLAPRPSYPLIEQLAALEGVEVAPYQLAYDGAWHIDFASLEAARDERVRAVLVVSPNNPTGSFLRTDELERLATLGLPILSDEVFASYSFGADYLRAESALRTRQALVFALGGLSKLAALPQMKLAWLTVGGPDEAVREALGRLEHIADAFLSPGTPVQVALPALLANRTIAEQAIQSRLANNLQRLRSLLDGSAASLLPVEGGWYATLRLPAVRFEEEWVVTLLEQDGVLVQPGWFYDFPDEPYAIVSLLTPESTFMPGVARIVQRAEQWAR